MALAHLVPLQPRLRSDARQPPLEPGHRPAEIHVRTHGEADAWEQAAVRPQVFAAYAHRSPQPHPSLDTALFPVPPVVIDDPLDPAAADVGLRTVRQNERVLDRNVDLVVEAVRYPQLELSARQLARVHAPVEGMEVMIAPLEHVAETAHEIVPRPRPCLRRRPRRRRGHSSNSMPSSPT